MAIDTDTGLGKLADLKTEIAEETVREPQIDAQGRSYATGKRKNAIARVWLKRGQGRITVNGKDQSAYFARPVLQMIIGQPFPAARRDGARKSGGWGKSVA